MSDAATSLPDGVTLLDHLGGPAVRVETPTSSAIIQLDGAHVASFVPAGGRDILWMSPRTKAGEGSAIRGGVPLVGPWFGPGRDGRTTPKHGWFRTSRWQLDEATVDADAARLVLGLRGADPSGHGITASLVVEVGAHLRMALTVTAVDAPLELECAFHGYLAVGDVRRCAIDGLGGAHYLDNMDDLTRKLQTDDTLRLVEETDRVYEVTGPVQVHDELLGRTLEARPEGSTRTVVWNPWAATTAGIADMPDESWTGFVCVEQAIAKDGFIALTAGESHTLSTTFSVR